MRRLGMNKKLNKGETAGLSTPDGDMWHLRY
jgi:hypothetical protein